MIPQKQEVADMEGIKRAGNILLKTIGILAIFSLLIGSLSWLKPEGAVQASKIIFVGTGEDADCAVLLSRDRCVVIDTGEEQDTDRILALLKESGVTQIDCMILTHPDKDHIGGASRLLDEVKVELVLAPYYAQDKETYTTLLDKINGMGVHFLTPSRNREFYYGDLRFRVFPPDNLMYEKDNDYSLITIVEHGDTRLLFMGDAEKKRILETESYRLRGVDLYKVPHHGRDSKVGASLIEGLKPSIAVVTAQNAGKEIEEALQQAGAEVYFTVPENNVVFISDGNTLTREPDHPGSEEDGSGGI